MAEKKATAKAAKPVKPVKAAKPAAAPVAGAPVDADVAKLDAEIEKETKAPEGVPVAPKGSDKPAAPIKVAKDEEGNRKIAPTGRFEAIGVEIFNREGVLVGTEIDESTANRKADRFNSLHR